MFIIKYYIYNWELVVFFFFLVDVYVFVLCFLSMFHTNIVLPFSLLSLFPSFKNWYYVSSCCFMTNDLFSFVHINFCLYFASHAACEAHAESLLSILDSNSLAHSANASIYRCGLHLAYYFSGFNQMYTNTFINK